MSIFRLFVLIILLIAGTDVVAMQVLPAVTLQVIPSSLSWAVYLLPLLPLLTFYLAEKIFKSGTIVSLLIGVLFAGVPVAVLAEYCTRSLETVKIKRSLSTSEVEQLTGKMTVPFIREFHRDGDELKIMKDESVRRMLLQALEILKVPAGY